MIKSKHIDWVINEKNHGHADISSWSKAELSTVSRNFSLFD